MAAEGDIRTLSPKKNGLVINNGVVYLSLDTETLEYLGTTPEDVISEKVQLVKKFDRSSHKGFKFIGIGVRKE
jgi:hypothetical protein